LFDSKNDWDVGLEEIAQAVVPAAFVRATFTSNPSSHGGGTVRRICASWRSLWRLDPDDLGAMVAANHHST
jgi:hypothetical protein